MRSLIMAVSYSRNMQLFAVLYYCCVRMVCLTVRVLFVRFVGTTRQWAKEQHVSVKT